MPLRAPILSNAFRQYARCLRELQKLFARGEDESPAGDAIRDESDEYWLAMTPVERERAGGLSADLYSLSEPTREPQDLNPQARGQLEEAVLAKQMGDWDRSLRLLRRWSRYVDTAALSRLRGDIWRECGDPHTAAAFLEHATQLQPDRGAYAALYLLTLDLADPHAATKVAESWVRDGAGRPPAAIIVSANILLRTISPEQANEVATAVEYAIARLDEVDSESRDTVAHRASFAALGSLAVVAGRMPDAFHTFDRGLALYPDDVPLLVARGTAHGLVGQLGVDDLQRAATLGPGVFEVDYLLARHHLATDDVVRCRQHCERALGKDGPLAARAEVAQWLGMARLVLGYPVEAVREAFELAHNLAPQDSRVAENLARFFRYLETKQVPNWVMRSPTEVFADRLRTPPTPLAA